MDLLCRLSSQFIDTAHNVCYFKYKFHLTTNILRYVRRAVSIPIFVFSARTISDNNEKLYNDKWLNEWFWFHCCISLPKKERKICIYTFHYTLCVVYLFICIVVTCRADTNRPTISVWITYWSSRDNTRTLCSMNRRRHIHSIVINSGPMRLRIIATASQRRWGCGRRRNGLRTQNIMLAKHKQTHSLIQTDLFRFYWT